MRIFIDRSLTLEGARTRLEPLGPWHLSSLTQRCRDEALWEFTFPHNPFTKDADAKDWLDSALSSPDHVAFAIIDTATKAVVGSTRYCDIQPLHRKVEIGGTFIALDHWGTHLNAECKYLLLRHAFECAGALRVGFKAEAINSRSRAALERIGATYEGTLRSFRIRSGTGEVRDTSFYSIIATAWPAIKTRLQERLQIA